jgi:hypothetical protein
MCPNENAARAYDGRRDVENLDLSARDRNLKHEEV